MHTPSSPIAYGVICVVIMILLCSVHYYMLPPYTRNSNTLYKSLNFVGATYVRWYLVLIAMYVALSATGSLVHNMMQDVVLCCGQYVAFSCKMQCFEF